MRNIRVLKAFKFAHFGHQVQEFEPSNEAIPTTDACADVAVSEGWALDLDALQREEAETAAREKAEREAAAAAERAGAERAEAERAAAEEAERQRTAQAAADAAAREQAEREAAEAAARAQAEQSAAGADADGSAEPQGYTAAPSTTKRGAKAVQQAPENK